MKEETKSFCGLINAENQKIIDSWSSECEYGFAACGCAAPGAASAESTSTTWPPLEHRPPGLCAAQASTPVFPEFEACVVISETDARTLVTAIDNARPSDVIAVIQRQPWFAEVRRGVRSTRHLKPTDYIKLSERQKQIPTE